MKIWYGAPGKVIDEKEIREGYREDKTGTTCNERNTGSWWRYQDPTENYFHIDNKRILLITIKQVITNVQIRYNLFTGVQTNYTTANREFIGFAHS